MKFRSIARMILAGAAVVPCLLLLLPVFAVAGLMALFVQGVRALGWLIEPRFVRWQELIEFDRELGWRPKPNLDACYLADRDDVHRVVTDREGWPGRRSLDDSRVVVIGDSFAFGYGVDAGRTFAELSDVPTKAVGAPGYSMVHGVLLMEQFAARLAGKLVVWFVYTENDLQDNLAPEMRQYRAPFAQFDPARQSWDIAGAHVHPAPWRSSNLDRSRLFAHFCVQGPVADRAYAAADYLITRAAAACRAAGARLALVTIPHPIQLSAAGLATLAERSGRPELCDPALPDRRIAESCRRADVSMIAATDFLTARDYKPREGIHWNEHGHRRMAALVTQLHASFATGELHAGTGPLHSRVSERLASVPR